MAFRDVVYRSFKYGIFASVACTRRVLRVAAVVLKGLSKTCQPRRTLMRIYDTVIIAHHQHASTK